MSLTPSERVQVAELLKRRAQEIAAFKADYTREGSHFGSVELALTREIDRLRRLADRVSPEELDDE